MTQNPISFSVQLTPNDLYRANVWALTRKLWFVWIFPILALVSISLSFVSDAQQKQQLMLNTRPLFYITGIYLLIAFVVPYFSTRSNFKTQMGLQQPTNYTFSETRIEMESASASSQTDWSNIYRVIETKSYLFIYLAKNLRYVIPKKFISDTQIVALRGIFRAGVKGKIKLRG